MLRFEGVSVSALGALYDPIAVVQLLAHRASV